MKTHFLLFILISILFSCNNDDTNIVSESDFYGDWGLISTKADREIDYDFDGDTAIDIIDDFNCFTIELKLNPDNTFSEVIIDRSIVNNKVECLIRESNGKWKYLRDSDQIEFNYLDINNNVINTLNSLFTIDKNNRFEFSREFTDNKGSFKASLQFLFINN